MVKSPVTVFLRGIDRNDYGLHIRVVGDTVDGYGVLECWIVRCLKPCPDKGVAMVHFVVM